MDRTKRYLICGVVFLCYTFALFGQDTPLDRGVGFGFQLNQYQKDFGAGLNITSPYFANDRVAVRLRGNILFYEHPDQEATTWTPYSNASLGFIGVVGYVGDIRLYSEGGIVGLFPSDKFSSDRTKFGGYGLFGFEFFFRRNGNYFVEIGGVGTGAKADKLPNQPVFSNGLIVGTGFRFHLPK